MHVDISFMTWNVENLFRPDAFADPGARDRYQIKLGLLAHIIRTRAPDVVALQEIGGADALDDLRQAVGSPYSHLAVSNFPDSRGIRVAFLSTLPIEEREDIVEFPPGPAVEISGLGPHVTSTPVTRMGRGGLRVKISKNGFTAHAINLHLKSKLLTYPSTGGNPRFQPESEAERSHAAGVALNRRSAEAVTLRLRANALIEANQNVALVVLGDFNDVPDAATTQVMQGPEGSEIGTRGFNAADKFDTSRLFNTSALIAEPRRFSRVHRGRGELLDQIFASLEFFPRDSTDSRRLPIVDSIVDFNAQLPSVTSDPGSRAKEISPDHAPVMAQFIL